MSEPQGLAGRVALVTGASRRGGIGFAIARQLARAGASVLLHAFVPYDAAQRWHREGEAAACLAELAAAGARAEGCEADLGAPDAPAALVERAFARFGRLDVVVANHTHWSETPLATLDAAALDRHLAVIVRGTLLLVSAFAARRPPGPGGRVVLLTSGQDRGPMPGEVAYAAAKGALAAATATLAAELAPRGITVNAVNPGPTDTGWVTEEMRAALLPRLPFGRLGTPEDTARLVGFLASDAAAWITGQRIDSEGGFQR
jgi:3-oxoacyl-[acyl-carrier protein] reductase